MKTITTAHAINAHALDLATEIHQESARAHRDIQAVTSQSPRLALALELHQTLLDNLDGLLKASREMGPHHATAWIIKVDGVGLRFEQGNTGMTTHPATADHATLMTADVASRRASSFRNAAGVPGVAMPYLSGLNDDILRCAKALHEASLVIQAVALEVPQGNA